MMIVPFWPIVMTVPLVVPGVDAVIVNAPATVPARRVTRATPLESVSDDPDAGLKPPVLSEVVKVTATLGAGWPLVSLTSACTIPGLVGEIVLVEFPDVSVSVRVMLDWPVGVVGVDGQPGSSGLRFGSLTQVLSPPPPPQPDRTAIAVTTANHFKRLPSCTTVTILVSLNEAGCGRQPTDGLPWSNRLSGAPTAITPSRCPCLAKRRPLARPRVQRRAGQRPEAGLCPTRRAHRCWRAVQRS